MKIEELEVLENKIKVAEEKRNKAAWEIEQIEKTWLEKFNCTSVTDAKKLLAEMTEKVEADEMALEKALAEIDAKLEAAV